MAEVVAREGMSSPDSTPVEILKWVRDELFALCEATESDPTLVRSSGDHEGKVGAYARGRLREAKGIRRAMGEVIAEKLRVMSDER
jgi:hypothetical protein